MKIYFIRRLRFAFLMLCASTASAEGTEWEGAVWGHIYQYIGTYNYVAILEDDAVSNRLNIMLGDDVVLLTDRLNARAPIGFSGACLILRGNVPHMGGIENAYMNVCPYSGSIDVVITTGTRIDIYTGKSSFQHLDGMLRAWIGQYQVDGHFGSTPEGIHFEQIPR